MKKISRTELKNSSGQPLGPEVWAHLKSVADYLSGKGIKSYLVGGWLRGGILGRETADIDVAVDADGVETARTAADTFGGKFVLLDKENGIGRVALPGESVSKGVPPELDFSTLRGDIEQDLALRDLTINAMAVELDILSGDSPEISFIDPFNGLDDLGTGIIRAVADGAFEADPARLLRAVRLAAELGFTVDGATEKLIKRRPDLLSNVAGERVREELVRLLAVPGSGKIFTYLDELGLLTVIFPEMEGTKRVVQPKEHHWDVFQHSLKTVKAVDFIFGDTDWEFVSDKAAVATKWARELNGHFSEEVGNGSTGKSLLKLAALLHDVNKPQAKTIESSGKMRFLGHADDGAVTVAGRLEKLRFSNKEIGRVETVVKHHLRPGQMSSEGLPGNRAIYRYFRDTGDSALDILFLSLADHLATRGPNLVPAAWQEHLELVNYVIGKRFEQEKIITPPKLVDGYDIMKIFKGSPGPVIGELLEAVREGQVAGEVVTRQEALALIEGLMTTSYYIMKKEELTGEEQKPADSA